MKPARLVIHGLNKSWSVPVLQQVALEVRAGEIRGIVGENGAGKSTLVNILAGLVPRDGGKIAFDGAPYRPQNLRAARDTGIACAMQELSTIDNLSVAENICIGRLPNKNGIVDRKQMRALAVDALERVGLGQIDVLQIAKSLSLAERQLLEVAKALASESKLLIFDEPTAALTDDQAERVHHNIRAVAKDGASVIYISHRLEDVLQICDRVSVLRDGKVVCDEDSSALSPTELLRLMSAASIHANQGAATSSNSGSALLRVSNVVTQALPETISLDCMQGEIVGLAGLAGAGRSELLRAAFGLSPPVSGTVSVLNDGAWRNIRSAPDAARAGIAYVGEDRKTMGVFKGLSVLSNTMIPGSRAPASRIDENEEARVCDEYIRQLDIKCTGLQQEISQLSGGNQQKVLLARWLCRDARVFLLDEPTRGVDVGTKAAIYDLLRSLRSAGKTILMSSSEMDELLAVCDRIAVMSDRKLVALRSAADWTNEALLAAAFQAHRGQRGLAMQERLT